MRNAKETSFGRPAGLAEDNDVAYLLVVPGQWTVRPESPGVETYSKEQRHWTTVYVYHRYHKKGWLAVNWDAFKHRLGFGRPPR